MQDIYITLFYSNHQSFDSILQIVMSWIAKSGELNQHIHYEKSVVVERNTLCTHRGQQVLSTWLAISSKLYRPVQTELYFKLIVRLALGDNCKHKCLQQWMLNKPCMVTDYQNIVNYYQYITWNRWSTKWHENRDSRNWCINTLKRSHQFDIKALAQDWYIRNLITCASLVIDIKVSDTVHQIKFICFVNSILFLKPLLILLLKEQSPETWLHNLLL